MEKLRALVNHPKFQWSIIAVILVNAIILGILTSSGLSPQQRSFLVAVDHICLAIFCIEMLLKIIVLRLAFFKSPWNIFDMLVIGVALAPASGGLSVLRSLRALRLMRLATALPSMRRVVSSMFRSIPGAVSVAGVLMVIYYVAAVMGVTFFRETNPKNFGDLGEALYTLFQMMTLEGWWVIADDVIEKNPNAWIFFVLFIIFTTFTTLNLMFGIIVHAMEEAREEEAREKLQEEGVEMTEETAVMRLAKIENEMNTITTLIQELEAQLPAR